jgi:conjugative relaxase-like TrwC/TraI family protein
MAIGFKKFIVGSEQTADSVIDYLADPHARGDYYTEGGQAVMVWLATPRLQRLFGLGGPIVLGRTGMRMLLEGRHPVTGEPIRRWGPNGTMVGATDVTLSPAPKSVSVLWALADRETRHEIERMVWLAADFAIARLMRKPLVRQRFGHGRNDVRHEAMPDIIGVQTLHTTARLSERGDGVPDPQLHVHSLLIGAVDTAGRLRALDSRQMMRVQREIDAHASAALAEMLRLRGFPIARTVDDAGQVSWELAGIPEAVLRLASSRRAEIMAEGPGSLREQYRSWCRERYGAEREPVGQAWDDFLAAHRGPKARLQGLELRQAWADQYGSAGWGLQQAREYIARAVRLAQAGIPPSDENQEAIEQFRQEFLADLCREYALVPESHVDAMTFEKAKGLIDVTTALTVVGAMFADGDLLVAPDGRVTTLGIVVEEQRARRAAQQLQEAEPAEAPSPEAMQRAIEEAARKGTPLDEHQTRAVRLATGGSRFVSITGKAGTGKGLTSGVMAPLWQAQGREVIALAVAGRTAQQAGHDARADLAKTIDSLVYAVRHGYRRIGASTVLVIDEAAMIDHSRYAALLEVAATAGATVVQVGDDRQLSPVGPGGLWTLIHTAAEARGLAVELRVVRRADEAAEAEAWNDVREGRVLEALQHWEGRGRLRLYDSRSDLQAGMAAQWWADQARGVMIVDTSNAERDVINRLAQEQRVRAGELGPQALTLANGGQVRAGDQVIVRQIVELEPAAGPHRVPRIENGTAATVTSVDEARGLAELALHEPHGERTVTVGRDILLNLAYVRHVQLGQGMTAEGAGQVGVSTSTDRERFYVMVSRARAGAVIHAVRSEVAALAAPGLGPVTPDQEVALRRLGLDEVPEDWTWADASVEIDVRRGLPLGEWAMQHLTATMKVEPSLAAHLVAQAIARRQAEAHEAVDLDQVASTVRAVVPSFRPAGERESAGQGEPEPTGVEPGSQAQRSAWEAFLAELQAHREAVEARAGLARLLSREGRKEAVGDRPMAVEPTRDETRQAERAVEEIDRDSRPGDKDYALARAWRMQPGRLAELPLPPREPDLVALRFEDGTEVTRGQVVRFGHPDWLVGAARREVQPGDLGVVLGCHRGGVTFDYATVELVGGRRIEVWQTAQGIVVEPDLELAAVREAVPRPDQRDPAALNVYELINGVRLMTGDRVRLSEAAELEGAGRIEAGAEGLVDDVQRHRHNRAVVELDDGRRASVYPQAPLEIVRPAREPAPVEPAGQEAQRQPELAQGVAPHQERWTRPLPAAKPLELVARWEATDQVPRALALYDALGQLHLSPTPERQAARLWLADPEAAIVVQTWEQAEAVRNAIVEERAAGREGEGVPAPTVLLAGAAYQSRVEAELAGESALVPERAYVVAGLADHDALTRALSVARESHLVTAPPDRLTTELQGIHAHEIAASMDAVQAEAAARAELLAGAERQAAAERSRELAIEAALHQAEAQHQAERAAQREIDRGDGR